jgi:inhibitor of KinA
VSEVKYLPQGESGLVVEFGTTIDPVINTRVYSLMRKIQNDWRERIEAIVPSYRSLLIFFDPLQIQREELINGIEKLLSFSQTTIAEEIQTGTGNRVIIPTCYGGEYGPDLEFVARHNKITPQEVIQIHTAVAYRIYMMGFTPGFPYLGGMSEKIATPRLEKPRLQIPAGSVGIAGSQTGLYPVESPGGWQLIGRTPLTVFNPEQTQPFLYAAGDFLQFEPISEREFNEIQNAVAQGRYTLRVTPLQEVSA